MPEVSERFQYSMDGNGIRMMSQSCIRVWLFVCFHFRDFTTPVPGVIETMEQLRREGIRIGSMTGLYQYDERLYRNPELLLRDILCRLSGNRIICLPDARLLI